MSIDVYVLFYLGIYFVCGYTYLYITLERYTLKFISDFSGQEFVGWIIFLLVYFSFLIVYNKLILFV